MSIFHTVPDGYYQESRIREQKRATPTVLQIDLQDVFIGVTVIALTIGGVRAVLAGGGTANTAVQSTTSAVARDGHR